MILMDEEASLRSLDLNPLIGTFTIATHASGWTDPGPSLQLYDPDELLGLFTFTRLVISPSRGNYDARGTMLVPVQLSQS